MESQESSVTRQVGRRTTCPWTADEDALLMRLKSSSSNSSWKDIAREFDDRRTVTACMRRYHKIMADARVSDKTIEFARLYY
ncbi:hypothetical protein E4U56_005324, partial [Claviceps arundinis]